MKLGVFDRISGLSYRMFGRQGKRLAGLIPSLRDQIIMSNLRITPEGLVSLALFATLLSVGGAVACFAVAVITGIDYIALGAIAPPLVFVIVLVSPKASQGSRASALDNEFPFVVGFLEVLAGGGVSPIAALRRIAGMTKIFPAASKEAKRVLVDIDVFGLDPITAFEKAARYSPNKLYKEFLYGYTTVLKTGGDVSSYTNIKLKEIFDNRSSKIRRSSDTVGTLAEAYLTVTAVLGITLFTLDQVQGIINHSTQGLQSLFLFSFLVIPALSILFIWIMDGIQAKQPYTDMRPYKSFLASLPVGAAIFFIPIPMDLPLHVAIALAATVVVPTFLATKYTRESEGMERSIPDFIRDVAEGRKIGLPPEGAIEQLTSKNYGFLSRSVRKMGSQISWGLSVSKVISSFVADVTSWITKVVGTLMVEVVDVGGGTVKSFSEMADFTRKVNDIEADKRSMLRPYVFVTYVSGLMLVITTFLMIYLLSQPLVAQGPAALQSISVDPTTIGQLLTASIFDSWVVGFVAGKMGEGSVAKGFKHALALVVISIAAVYLMGIFVKVPV